MAKVCYTLIAKYYLKIQNTLTKEKIFLFALGNIFFACMKH